MRLLCFAALAAAVLAAPASADSLTTTFAGGNAATGNMFDATTLGGALTVTALDVHITDNGAYTLDVWTRPGTHVGFETSAVGWTLVSSTGLVGNGNGSFSHGVANFVDVTDFTLAGGATTGMYVTVRMNGAGTFMNYSNGASVFADANLSLSLMTGVSGIFGNGNGIFTPRSWNGTVYYDAVPEPASLLLLAGGVAVFGLRKRRKA